MQRARTRTFLAATAAAAALVLGACGGDDDATADPGTDDTETPAATDTGTDTDTTDPDTDTDTDTDVSGDDEVYVRILADELLDDPENPFTDSEAECVARQFISIIGGASAIEAAGVTPEDFAETDGVLGAAGMDFTDDQAREFGAAFGRCDISFVDLFADGMGEISDDARQCLRDNLTDEVIGSMFVLLGQDDDDAVDALIFDAISPCIPLLAE